MRKETDDLPDKYWLSPKNNWRVIATQWLDEGDHLVGEDVERWEGADPQLALRRAHQLLDEHADKAKPVFTVELIAPSTREGAQP